MKRVISLWFPKLSTDRLARLNAKDWSARAAATVIWRDNCPRLAAVNPQARERHERAVDAAGRGERAVRAPAAAATASARGRRSASE